jgi:hypothetical protein
VSHSGLGSPWRNEPSRLTYLPANTSPAISTAAWTCQTLQLKLIDGTMHHANFKFTGAPVFPPCPESGNT